MCECIAQMDEGLAPYGVYIDQASINTWTDENPQGVLTQRVRLTTQWLSDRKGKKRKMLAIASHCPFCGERYLPREELET